MVAADVRIEMIHDDKINVPACPNQSQRPRSPGGQILNRYDAEPPIRGLPLVDVTVDVCPPGVVDVVGYDEVMRARIEADKRCVHRSVSLQVLYLSDRRKRWMTQTCRFVLVNGFTVSFSHSQIRARRNNMWQVLVF